MQIKNYKIGVLVLCALVILYKGLHFLQGRNLFSNYNVYQITYPINKNLSVSAPVKFRGHEVGKVVKIELSPKHDYNTLVTIEVDKKFPLTDTSKVMLNSMGMGMLESNALELDLDHKGKPLTKNDLIIGQLHPNFHDMDFNTLTAKLTTIMSNLMDTIGNVNTILNNFEKTTCSLHTAIRSVHRHVNTIANNIVAISTPLADPVGGIPSMLPVLHSILREIKSLPFKEFSCKTVHVLNNVELLLQNISGNEGTLGRFINDATFYHNLNSSVENLNALLFNIKKQPSRYVHFALINFNNKK